MHTIFANVFSRKKALAIAAMAFLLVSFMIPALSAPVSAHVGQDSYVFKVHPELLSVIESSSDDEVIKFMVRLQGVPVETLASMTPLQVKERLKSHAETTQGPVIDFIEDRGGVVENSFWLVNDLLVQAPAAVARELAQLSLVKEIFPVFKVEIPDVEAEAEPRSVLPAQYEWNIERIGAPQAWDAGITGAGIRVGVSDTGIYIEHPDLFDALFTIDPTSPYYPGGWMEFDYAGNPVLSTPWDSPWLPHGSHVSGTITGGNASGTYIGVAPDAKIMMALALPHGGGEFPQVLAAMEWKLDPFYIDPETRELVYTGLPAHVTSMSWGGPMEFGYYFWEIIRNTLLCNVVPVAAAGNAGVGYVGSPAVVWGVFAAGATDMYDGIAWWSSGAEIYEPSPPLDWPFFPPYPTEYVKPDFSAPGDYVKSSVPWGWEYWSGTSMATPHISATIALMLQAAFLSPSITPEVIYEILRDTALDFGDPGQDVRYGWGRINSFDAAILAQAFALSGVEGFLYDKVTGEPVEGATVTALETGTSTRTNASGYYKLGTPEGTWTIRFEKYGYFDYQTTVEVVILNGTIQGNVTDLLIGVPLEGAQILVVETGQTFLTDETGFYQGEVKAGLRTLIASKDGYVEASASVFVPEEEVVVADFQLLPVGTGTLRGRVMGEAPIANALVLAMNTITDETFASFTDADGNYTVEVSAGIYYVIVFPAGHYTKAVSDILVLPDTTVIIDFEVAVAPPNRVAVYGDYYGQLTSLLAASGWDPVQYPTTADALGMLLNITSFSVIAWPGWAEWGPLIPRDIFYAILTLADFYGVSFVFSDSSWSASYGIDHLVAYLGDPWWKSWTWYLGEVYYNITADHPIFSGIGSVGDLVYIIWGGDQDHAWFGDFSGDVIANVGNDKGIMGNGVGVKEIVGYFYTTRWVLLGSLAPQPYTDMYGWYDAAGQIYLNSVEWAFNSSWATASTTGSGEPPSIDTRSLTELAKAINPSLEGPSIAGVIEPAAFTALDVWISPMQLSVDSGKVGTEVTLTSGGAQPNAPLLVYYWITYPTFTEMLVDTPQADPEGDFTSTFTIPESPYGTHFVYAVDPETGQDGLAGFFVTPGVQVQPARASPGKMVTVSLTGFWPQVEVWVTFEDVFQTVAITNTLGSFTANIFVPQIQTGEYRVKGLIPWVPEIFDVDWITVVDVTPIDVKADVGSIHFRGEIAEFYVLTAFNGTPVNTTVTKAVLYHSEGTVSEDLTAYVVQVSTGLYRIPYTIPADAPLGTYVLVVEAGYTDLLVESKGTTFGAFLLSPTLTGLNALITAIEGNTATIMTDVGEIKVSLDDINARITAIEGDVVTITTDIGTMKADVAAIKPVVTEIDGNVATVMTDVGAIKGTIITVDGNVATVKTDVGTIKADVSGVKTDLAEVPPAITGVTTTIYVVIILALIAAIASIYSAIAKKRP